MSSKPNGSQTERRNTRTVDIDRLATLDMLTLINQQDKRVADAIAACLPDIARLTDNACAVAHCGGRVVLAGAGPSGRMALDTADDFAPDNRHALLGLSAGDNARHYESGATALQGIGFCASDMLVVLSVSGNTPWSLGALHYASSLGARVALITRGTDDETAQRVDIVIAADSGAEVVSGFSEPKARLAQQQILTMLTTALAVRSGRVFSNLRVDVQATDVHWAERQIALVTSATQCSREDAKHALAAGGGDCRKAILMLLTGVNAATAAFLLVENNDHLRLALRDAKPLNAVY